MSDRPPNQISEGRKTTYYVGTALAVIGGVLFASPFMAFACFMIGVADFSPMEDGFPTYLPVTFGLAFIGFFLIAGGMMLSHVGRSGLAGSGVILDPEQAREDLKPWNKMAGGMIESATLLRPAKTVLSSSINSRSLSFLGPLHLLFDDGQL